jgi:hypothetical protein
MGIMIDISINQVSYTSYQKIVKGEDKNSYNSTHKFEKNLIL